VHAQAAGSGHAATAASTIGPLQTYVMLNGCHYDHGYAQQRLPCDHGTCCSSYQDLANPIAVLSWLPIPSTLRAARAAKILLKEDVKQLNNNDHVPTKLVMSSPAAAPSTAAPTPPTPTFALGSSCCCRPGDQRWFFARGESRPERQGTALEKDLAQGCDPCLLSKGLSNGVATLFATETRSQGNHSNFLVMQIYLDEVGCNKGHIHAGWAWNADQQHLTQ
jgi:hypothetical protein